MKSVFPKWGNTEGPGVRRYVIWCIAAFNISPHCNQNCSHVNVFNCFWKGSNLKGFTFQRVQILKGSNSTLLSIIKAIKQSNESYEAIEVMQVMVNRCNWLKKKREKGKKIQLWISEGQQDDEHFKRWFAHCLTMYMSSPFPVLESWR
jgi:hypothetical protein